MDRTSIIYKRIGQCVIDKLQKSANIVENRYILENLDNAIITFVYIPEYQFVVDYDYNELPPKKFDKFVEKRRYTIFILFQDSNLAIIPEIPNIELTFRDSDIVYTNIPFKLNWVVTSCIKLDIS